MYLPIWLYTQYEARSQPEIVVNAAAGD